MARLAMQSSGNSSNYDGQKPQKFISLASVNEIINKKHKKYHQNFVIHNYLYYVTRITAALAAGAIPFIINYRPDIATWLSAVIVVAIITDTIVNPKEKSKLYSKATDMLWANQVLLEIAALEKDGKHKEAEKLIKDINIILDTEDAILRRLTDINEILHNAQYSK